MGEFRTGKDWMRSGLAPNQRLNDEVLGVADGVG